MTIFTDTFNDKLKTLVPQRESKKENLSKFLIYYWKID